jgi:Putative metal-binding motif
MVVLMSDFATSSNDQRADHGLHRILGTILTSFLLLFVTNTTACVSKREFTQEPTPTNDYDKDGRSEVQGDCDDTDPSIGGDPQKNGWVPGSCDSGNAGICSAGTKQCIKGKPACVSNLSGTKEVCNGLDDDCDGEIDNGNPGGGGACPTNKQGECKTGAWQCIGGNLNCISKKSTLPEICNGLDDDCNDIIDDGNPGGGALCLVPGMPGICSQGITMCMGGGVQCLQNVSPSAAESCNGLDDTCDGQTDEGDPGGGGACDVPGKQGECKAGVLHCIGGSLTCVANKLPVPEVCNGLDDDCIGGFDDGNPGGGALCLVPGMLGICSQGTMTCVSVPGKGGLQCLQSVPAAAVESCNGLDDTCDGQTDEGDPGGGGSCNVPGKLGACQLGLLHCIGGSLTCVASKSPLPEICGNNIDDDCDGNVDNGCPVCHPVNWDLHLGPPLMHTGGDSAFQGNGPIVHVTANISRTSTDITVSACVTMTETTDDWTSGVACDSKTVSVASTGFADPNTDFQATYTDVNTTWDDAKQLASASDPNYHPNNAVTSVMCLGDTVYGDDLTNGSNSCPDCSQCVVHIGCVSVVTPP